MTTSIQVREKAVSKSVGISFYKNSGKGYFINFNEYTEDGFQKCSEVTKRFYDTINVPVV